MIVLSKRFSIGKLIALALLILGPGPALACKLPVFRYALERWEVDRYRLVALVNDERDATVDEALALLRSLDSQSMNVEVEIIELATLSEDQWWQLEGLDGEAASRLQVHFPKNRGEVSLGWSGELTAANVRAWMDSPVRNTLVEDLVAGVSVVWLQVDGADENQNARVAEQLDAALKRASQEMTIPDGVIAQDDAAEYLQQHPEASLDDVLRSDVPLKVEFRSHRISREDADEWATVAMIDGLRGKIDQPLLVPVFGRGRMLDAIPCDGVKPDVIVNACRYMVGECSCTVKALHPGADLLLRVNWQQALGADLMVVASSIQQTPVLVEIPEGETSEDATALSLSATTAAEPFAADTTPSVTQLPVARFSMQKRVGIGALVLGILWFAWSWTTRRRHITGTS